jgi:hypothetical protein
MFRKFSLQAGVWHRGTIEFEWDGAGGLRGRDAELVRDLLESSLALGYVVSHPMPTSYLIRDPFRDLADLAVVLGVEWQLDEPLRAAHPVIPDEGDATVELLYGDR